MKIKTLKEEEEKYVIDYVNKRSLWSKEFIVYQWYETDSEDDMLESKIKIIFDMLNTSIKAVRVIKERINYRISNKKVYYLNIDEVDYYDLLGKPLIAKRRSIKGNLFLDQFFISNGKCEYLLEIEKQELMEPVESTEFKIIKNVTEDKDYLNKNMAIPFSEKNLAELEILIDKLLKVADK